MPAIIAGEYVFVTLVRVAGHPRFEISAFVTFSVKMVRSVVMNWFHN